MTFDESFWYAVSFGIFILLISKPFFELLKNALETKQKQIRQDLESAQELKNLAHQHLLQSKREHLDALERAQEIVKRAEGEAKRLHDEAMNDVVQFFKNQEVQLQNRLEHLENQAHKELTEVVTKTAIRAAQGALESMMTENLNEKIVLRLLHQNENKGDNGGNPGNGQGPRSPSSQERKQPSPRASSGS